MTEPFPFCNNRTFTIFALQNNHLLMYDRTIALFSMTEPLPLWCGMTEQLLFSVLQNAHLLMYDRNIALFGMTEPFPFWYDKTITIFGIAECSPLDI